MTGIEASTVLLSLRRKLTGEIFSCDPVGHTFSLRRSVDADMLFYTLQKRQGASRLSDAVCEKYGVIKGEEGHHPRVACAALKSQGL